MSYKDVLAFPHEYKFGDGTAERTDGMTLRDYFAAKAMQSIMVGAVLPTREMRDEWLPKAAGVAYEVADAMLKERNKT